MDQRMMAQIGGPAQRVRTLEQRRCTNRKERCRVPSIVPSIWSGHTPHVICISTPSTVSPHVSRPSPNPALNALSRPTRTPPAVPTARPMPKRASA
jgi:hypothetical protein